MNESKKLTRQKVVLTANDHSLMGRISGDAEHVHILLDTGISGYTVILPDAAATMQRELIFKNIGANTANIVPQAGQLIDNSTSAAITSMAALSLWSDRNNYWII
jgi:hypothetical protein